MSIHTMRFPVELEIRPRHYRDPPTGCALNGIDADGKSIHFDDVLVEGDRVAGASERDDNDEATGNDFGPFGVVVATDGGLRIVAEEEEAGSA